MKCTKCFYKVIGLGKNSIFLIWKCAVGSFCRWVAELCGWDHIEWVVYIICFSKYISYFHNTRKYVESYVKMISFLMLLILLCIHIISLSMYPSSSACLLICFVVRVFIRGIYNVICHTYDVVKTWLYICVHAILFDYLVLAYAETECRPFYGISGISGIVAYYAANVGNFVKGAAFCFSVVGCQNDNFQDSQLRKCGQGNISVTVRIEHRHISHL